MVILSPPADWLLPAAITLLAFFVSVYWLEYLFSGSRPYVKAIVRLGVFGWIGVWRFIAGSGALQHFDRTPPPMAMMMAGAVFVSIAIGLSSFGRNATLLPFSSLIGLQAFRFPLELLMHRGVTLGIVPVELSYTGYNIDIVTGIGAALIAIALSRGVAVPRGVLWIWNIFGWICLAVILAVAVLGSPMLHRFGTDPRHVNTWVLFFPYVLVPTALVVTALSAHVVITRKLLS